MDLDGLSPLTDLEELDEPSTKRFRTEDASTSAPAAGKAAAAVPADDTAAAVGTAPQQQPHVQSSGLVPQQERKPQPPAEPPDLSAAQAVGSLKQEDPAPVQARLPGQVVTELKQVLGAYSQREEYLIKQEQLGEIAFKYVPNDGSPDHMIYLTGLKNIFSKQLPNMPKEYICRLVFDRRHRSVVLLKRNGTVMGGITYRAFHAQAFGEIAFCAITSNEQVKGYGTRLMNQTKEAARVHDKLTHFLTYADNNAVGYFAKQGFTKEITMDRERWVGYIKDYDGGTLMECFIHPKISHTGLPAMVRQQRAALEGRVRCLSHAHVVRPGLDHFALAAQEGVRHPGPVPIEAIPGVLDTSWQRDTEAQGGLRYRLLFRDGVQDVTPTSLQRFMQRLLDFIKANEDSWPFHEPVSAQDVPDYYDVIRDPVDLSLIAQRLHGRAFYISLDIFVADLRRMFNNCRTYNSADTIYYKVASKLEALMESWLNTHMVYDAR